MPEVSVVIPAYNTEKYISETIKSVLNQTYQDFEIIIVDDGSTDGVAKISKGYVNKYLDKIRYLCQENKGPAAARNKGIKEARGVYIAFLDSDDVWLPNKLKKQIEVFNHSNTTGLICTGRIRIGQETMNKEIRNTIKEYDSEVIKVFDYLDLWTKSNFIVTSSVMIRKKCIQNSGLFDETKEIQGSEDFDLWLRIAERYKIVCIYEPLVEYRVREEGFCRSNVKRDYESSAYVIRKHQSTLKECCEDSERILRNKWFNFYFNYGMTLFHLHRVKDSHVQFKISMNYSIFNVKAWVYFFITFLGDSFIKRLRVFKRYMSKE